MASEQPFVKAVCLEGPVNRAYELEIMFHMAGLSDLLRAVGYPYLEHRRPGLKLHEDLARGTFDVDRVSKVKSWVLKWVVAPVRDRMGDVEAFMGNAAEQAWFHSWLHTRQGWSVQYRNWGALSLCCLLGVEPSVLQWVTHLYSHFFRQGNFGTMDGRPRLSFDAYQFCPSLHTVRGNPETALPTVFRLNERLGHHPHAKHYGSLEPGKAQPTTHLDFMINLDSEEQRAELGDVCLTYSEDSEKMSLDTRIQRLVDGMKDGTRHRTPHGKSSYVTNVIEEEEILRAMKWEDLKCHNATTGFDLTPRLGVTVKVHGGRRQTDPTTCPLWVGPARFVNLKPGEIVAWPSNLVHGFRNFHIRREFQKRRHLVKRLNFSTSFQILPSGTHPHITSWKYAWGLPSRVRRKEKEHTPTIHASFPPCFFRSVSDTMQHSDDGYSYSTSVKAMSYAIKHVPETKAFISLPVQLARALTFRFPEVFMSRDTLDLARDLATRMQEWDCTASPLATSMVRELWTMFE